MNWNAFITSVHESSATLHVAVIIVIQGFPILFSIIMHCSIGGAGGPPEIYEDGTAFKYLIMKFTLQGTTPPYTATS